MIIHDNKKWIIVCIIIMIKSTTVSASPPLFHCILSFGKERSLIANLIMLPAGWCQKQILAFLCLLTRIMQALDFGTKSMIRNRHPYKTRVQCQTPPLSNSQWNPTSSRLLRKLALIYFYQGSNHTHRNYINSFWLLHSLMNFHSVHELAGRKGTD